LTTIASTGCLMKISVNARMGNSENGWGLEAGGWGKKEGCRL
jgi:hypothetical protein